MTPTFIHLIHQVATCPDIREQFLSNPDAAFTALHMKLSAEDRDVLEELKVMLVQQLPIPSTEWKTGVSYAMDGI